MATEPAVLEMRPKKYLFLFFMSKTITSERAFWWFTSKAWQQHRKKKPRNFKLRSPVRDPDYWTAVWNRLAFINEKYGRMITYISMNYINHCENQSFSTYTKFVSVYTTYHTLLSKWELEKALLFGRVTSKSGLFSPISAKFKAS